MNRLQVELRRLYLISNSALDGINFKESGLISPEGAVRAMVLELARPADWHVLSTLWQGVQTDLKLPAPAIAVSGIDGYQLWFSLSEPVPAAEATRFLALLCLRYLSNIAPGRIAMRPSVDASVSGRAQHAKMVPTLWKETGRWSAYIASDLASVFSDEPWLDVCPSPEAQADVLSRLVSIKAVDFQMVLGRLNTAAKAVTSFVTLAPTKEGSSKSDLQSTGVTHSGNSLNPKRFLLDVMGDPTIELHLRIQAAQALMPYFENEPRSAA